MNYPCARCAQAVTKASAVWTMWGGRLVRVGPDCAQAIRSEREVPWGSGGGQRPRQAATVAQNGGSDAAIGGGSR